MSNTLQTFTLNVWRLPKTFTACEVSFNCNLPFNCSTFMWKFNGTLCKQKLYSNVYIEVFLSKCMNFHEAILWSIFFFTSIFLRYKSKVLVIWWLFPCKEQEIYNFTTFLWMQDQILNKTSNPQNWGVTRWSWLKKISHCTINFGITRMHSSRMRPLFTVWGVSLTETCLDRAPPTIESPRTENPWIETPPPGRDPPERDPPDRVPPAQRSP